MRHLSHWAKKNRPIAIVCLILLKISLLVLSFLLASLLGQAGFVFPSWLCYIFLLLLMLAVAAYPKRRQDKRKFVSFYVRQKTCDFTIALSAFLMITIIINTDFNAVTRLSPPAYGVVNSTKPTAEEILASLQYRDKSSLSRQEKRILKQEFKKQLKIYTRAKFSANKDEAGKAGLIILTILAALGILYLVAALACSLSCSGADGAALAVAIIGVTGVVIGAVLIIQRISRGPKKKPQYISN